MLNEQLYDKLYLELKDDISSVEEILYSIQKLYKNLPITENVKKNFTDFTLKQKSGWYACLVNQNIDVLLLPEYLESKQSRNILIKKETDQYFKSIEHFDLLSGKSSSELFECILYGEQDSQKSAGLDLFSAQVVETAKCPEALAELMSSWGGKFVSSDKLTSIVFELLEWHVHNHYSFVSNRQIILWLNYQFKQAFGQIAYRFNHEKYFFHHWNKESRDFKTSVKELLNHWKQEAEEIKKELSILYRSSIAYDNLKSSQKIIANHLFSNAFSIQYPQAIQISQYPALKPLLKRGFVELSDFNIKEDFEKYKPILDELLTLNFIKPMREDEIFIVLNPGFQSSKSRLHAYDNVKYNEEINGWDEFINQTITLTKAIVPDSSTEKMPDTFMVEASSINPEIKPNRKKAFFG
ncbi:MAG: hypothetical protein IT245_04975 [Bacteroidia bacterium]|nr:hypothetical protein [Bacteroidia bacterium]